ncbi:C39 family peptidase, partial [Patescibacteria group bacterium]|nr:C39 family peptidase [Patescibacteria group bacterium]
VRGEGLTLLQAETEILALVDFEEKTYGYSNDTSAEDTAKLFKSYFNYDLVSLRYGIDYQDIKVELAKGNLIIVPANGTKLGNPYFTPPGPLEHMLVIRGYDDLTQEFITNDPGTKRGEGFRYDYQVLENAIRDYPSGYHEPITRIRKVMIIIEK